MFATFVVLLAVVAAVQCDLTSSQLKQMAPSLSDSKADEYLPYINAAMNKFNINTPKRVAHFMAQLLHESGELKWMEEFATGKAYEGRRDLGNTQKGDGVKYKGRGPIQVTGRDAYKKCGAAIGADLVSNPKLLVQPQYGFMGSAWVYAEWKDCNPLADKDNIVGITKKINGGSNGLADRKKKLALAKKVLGV
eukprot:TRINITY_DN92_c0_g1_i1.p1 TRINITY_DN92_c0_g1~~TRINITY_DN92_c0_g1_i1.p1  ORF type:complete len:193 (+),score=32.28 TRINITY_DN92_c0_g1_i1:417-995(+)